MKTAIVVLSDPESGGEEALGRVFNALATAYDLRAQGLQTKVVFQGAGTRWPARLRDAQHPAHALYEAVREDVGGVSCACADVFGARDEAGESGLALLTDNRVPGTSGLASIAKDVAAGWNVVTF